MKTKNETMPKTITTNELALLSGYSARRIRQLIQEGKLSRRENGILPFDAVRQLFQHILRESDELKTERIGKIKVERQLKQVQMDKLSGAFKSVEVFNSHLVVFGKTISDSINRMEPELEKAIALKIVGGVPDLSDGQKIAVGMFTSQGVIESFEELRQALRTALENAGEPQPETQEVPVES